MLVSVVVVDNIESWGRGFPRLRNSRSSQGAGRFSLGPGLYKH